jgi:predicted outer membrane repeat protein
MGIGDLTITDCVFSDLQAVYGGGVFNIEGSARLTRCRFRDNRAAFGGGAMYFGFSQSAGDGTMSPSSVVHGFPRLDDCTFVDNHATESGGAVYIAGVAEDATFRSCRFHRNSADQDGGAIYVAQGTQLIHNCLFSENRAGGTGGGLYFDGIACYRQFDLDHSGGVNANDAGLRLGVLTGS